jgi:hypothetical protein
MAAGLVGIHILNKRLFAKFFSKDGISRAAEKTLSAFEKEFNNSASDVLEKIRGATNNKAVKNSWRKEVVSPNEILICSSHKRAPVIEYGSIKTTPQAPIRKTLAHDPLNRRALTKKLLDIFKGEV